MADRPQTTSSLPGQVVLVFQGGGALGAYQGGVYQALHKGGIEPSAGIYARWHAGYADTMRMLERRPWETPVDPMAGVAVYDSDIQS